MQGEDDHPQDQTKDDEPKKQAFHSSFSLWQNIRRIRQAAGLMMDQRLDPFTVPSEQIHFAVQTIAARADVGFVLIGPASGVGGNEGGALKPLFHRALHILPARHHGLYPANTLDGNLVLVDGSAYAFQPLDIRQRVETLIPLTFLSQNEAASLVHAESKYRDSYHSSNSPDRVLRC